ncbi:CopG family transcriptional regulator [bacterium]|nr:CopG family transcriptional regulator [bacterium]
MPLRKQEVITFKVDHRLAEALGGIQNRSAFIRNAVLAALDGACPLCKGTGILTPAQRIHWQEFAQTHHTVQCHECEAVHLVCEVSGPSES